MRTKLPQHKCCDEQSECGHIADERNRYFTGKYMTARDFADEQSYFLSRHRLHNRLLHGWGIVCGLKVVHHPNPDCARRWVVIHPGIALDCCGRELIIKCETAFKLPLPRPQESEEDPPQLYPVQAASNPGDRTTDEAENEGAGQADDAEEMREPFLLVLRYVEEEIERVPALYSEGECDPSRKEANRIRERAVFDVVRLDDVEGNCWLNPEGDPEARCRDDCDDDLPGPGRSCLNPVCPCGHVVPLALITPNEYDEDFEIDLLGRRYLPTPPEFLTHIVDINWPHGGELTLAQIRNDLGGQLAVRFDRKLLPADGDKTGINRFTFLVEIGGVQRTLEFLPADRDYPPTLKEDCVAVFKIDEDYIIPRRDRHDSSIEGTMVYVTLRCDFILDCHNNPVDGNFLRGRFPTGDGVPGGVFESWFHVAFANHYGSREEE